MNEEMRRSVIVAAQERALAYPAHVERPLSFGARQYRTRIMRLFAIFLVASLLVVGGLLTVFTAAANTLHRAVTEMTVSPSTLQLHLAEQAALTVTLVYSDGSAEQPDNGVVDWTSSEPSVAAVTPGGAVLAHAVGTATITATTTTGDRTLSSSSTVTVLAVALTGIVLTPPSAALSVGDTVSLSTRGQYADGSSRPLGETLTWSTSDAGVASVDESGVVSAHAAGDVVITAAADAVSATAAITVTARVEPTGVRVTPAEIRLAVGKRAQLTAVTVFTDGTTAPLTDSATSWSSSSEKVARVNGSGLVTAGSEGTATIEATAGGFSDTASIIVTVAELTSITISPLEAELVPGETMQFTVTGHYSDGTTAALDSAEWSSSDEAAITVDDKGLATALSARTSSRITATVNDLSDTASVTVVTAPLVRITVSPAYTKLNIIGESVQLTATGHYSDGTTVVLDSAAWTSSGPAVTVSSSGVATLIAEGADATITAAVGDVAGTARVDAPHVVE